MTKTKSSPSQRKNSPKASRLSKLPTSIYILGKPYQILYTDDTQSGGSILGAANKAQSQIVLRKDISSAQIRETLLHEVIHMISQELMLGFEEETVSRLSVGLFSAGIEIDAFRSIARS